MKTWLTIIICVGLAVPAAAQEVKTDSKIYGVDFGQVLRMSNGQPFEMCDKFDGQKCEHTVDATLRRIAVLALGSAERGIALDEQVKRGLLAIKIDESLEPVVLSVEDIALIKKKIGDLGISSIEVARAIKLLDPAAAK